MTHTHLDSHHIPSIKHLPEVNGFQKKRTRTGFGYENIY